jgi:hypothetical protein
MRKIKVQSTWGTYPKKHFRLTMATDIDPAEVSVTPGAASEATECLIDLTVAAVVETVDLIDLTTVHDIRTTVTITPNVGLCDLTMTAEVDPAVAITPGPVGVLATNSGVCNVLLGNHPRDFLMRT